MAKNIPVKTTDFVCSPNGVMEAVGNGQHVLERHVGLSDAELLTRLNNDPTITGASTFTDDITENNVVSSVLQSQNNIKTINSWLSLNPGTKLVLRYNGTAVIGRGVKRGSQTVKDLKKAKIVLKSNGLGGYDILTAYPT